MRIPACGGPWSCAARPSGYGHHCLPVRALTKERARQARNASRSHRTPRKFQRGHQARGQDGLVLVARENKLSGISAKRPSPGIGRGRGVSADLIDFVAGLKVFPGKAGEAAPLGESWLEKESLRDSAAPRLFRQERAQAPAKGSAFTAARRLNTRGPPAGY